MTPASSGTTELTNNGSYSILINSISYTNNYGSSSSYNGATVEWS